MNHVSCPLDLPRAGWYGGAMTQATLILKRIFGYDAFWPLQGEIIGHLLEKKDALVVMPTGGGKSLCYQIPALLFEGLTLVVSPLISLMKDQVDQLRECGVPALFLNSSLSADQYRSHVGQIRDNAVKLVYLAPEAPADAPDTGPAVPPEDRLPRHRRGPLHLRMGTRFPPGVPPAPGGPLRLPRGGLRGPDRDRDTPGPGGYPDIPADRHRSLSAVSTARTSFWR